MVSSTSLGFHVEWFYKLQGWDLREFWNSILAHHPVLIGLDVSLWCRTDIIGLPRTVSKGAKSHDAIRSGGDASRGHRGDDVRIAWNLAGWREITFWSRITISWMSPKFRRIPSLRPRKQCFSIYCFSIYSNICFSLITFSLKVRIRSRLFWDDP